MLSQLHVTDGTDIWLSTYTVCSVCTVRTWLWAGGAVVGGGAGCARTALLATL